MVSRNTKDLRELKAFSPYRDPVLLLPIELICQVFKWLDITDVCSCRLVSTRWNRSSVMSIKNWKELNLTDNPIISDSGLNAIFKITRHLKVVRLDKCWKCATEQNLVLLSQNCPKLRALSASRCKWVTDDAIRVLCETCKELQELDFSSCYQISDKGIAHVRQCRDLRELCVSSCYGVTDESIKEVTRHCLKLRELDVSWCPLVTDTALKPLLANCQLQLLRIKCCKRVSSGMILELMNAGISVNNMF